MNPWPNSRPLRAWLWLAGGIAALFIGFVVVAITGGVGHASLGNLYWWGLVGAGTAHGVVTWSVVRTATRRPTEIDREWVVGTIVYTGVELVLLVLFLAWLAQPFPI
jgi:hypothetical protein